jgi:hypothetical protein
MIKSLVVAAVLTLAPAVFAQTHIEPEGDCGAMTFHVLGADRLSDAWIFLPQQRTAVMPVAGSRSLDLSAEIPKDGVSMAAVDVAPVVSGNETRTEHAKAFVYCGAKAPAADWQRSTGLGVEIYPQWNGSILHLTPGRAMEFIAVDGTAKELLRDVPLELYRDGEHVATVTPDRNGIAKFPYPGPGRYMVMTTYRRADPQHAEHWLVDTSTATFELK